MKKDNLQIGEIYHVFNKSIAGYKIFNSESHFYRMKELMKYYNKKNVEYKYSRYIELINQGKNIQINQVNESDKLVSLIAYCIMPTHLHLILKQLAENGITIFMRKILDSYSRYFNIRHNRKGPLWISRFKSVLVSDDEQLLHLTRYLHLNPTTAGLVKKPEDWKESSYNEYLGKINNDQKICKFDDVLRIESKPYQKFVNSQRSYQRELSIIKKIVID